MSESNMKKLEKRLVGATRKAIEDFKMITNGDHVAVGISGGKDSIALLFALNELRKYNIVNFKLSAITINLGFESTTPSIYKKISDYCDLQGINYYVVDTKIYDIVFKSRNESNPCSLCSNMRRGALNIKCQEIGANKLALGHHKRDLVDTFLLSMFYENRFYTFKPVTFLDRSGITVIRPLLYVEEGMIVNITKDYNLPFEKSPCPLDKASKREEVRIILNQISKTIPSAEDSIFSAIMHPERMNLSADTLPSKEKKQELE